MDERESSSLDGVREQAYQTGTRNERCQTVAIEETSMRNEARRK